MDIKKNKLPLNKVRIHTKKRILRICRRDGIIPDDALDACRNVGTIYFLEPEIVDEIFDIKSGRKSYRVFVNRKLNRIIFNEIISYNHKGVVLLKNPANTIKSEKFKKELLALPKNEQKPTVSHFTKSMAKYFKQEELNNQPKNPAGNRQNPILQEAVLWCIKNHPKELRSKRPTLLLAYKEFEKEWRKVGKKDSLESSFVNSVRSKWSKVKKLYNKQPEEFKKQNSLLKFARNYFKTLRNNSKQKTKEDGKFLNNNFAK
jgi:hypothetical protein